MVSSGAPGPTLGAYIVLLGAVGCLPGAFGVFRVPPGRLLESTGLLCRPPGCPWGTPRCVLGVQGHHWALPGRFAGIPGPLLGAPVGLPGAFRLHRGATGRSRGASRGLLAVSWAPLGTWATPGRARAPHGRCPGFSRGRKLHLPHMCARPCNDRAHMRVQMHTTPWRLWPSTLASATDNDLNSVYVAPQLSAKKSTGQGREGIFFPISFSSQCFAFVLSLLTRRLVLEAWGPG